MAAKNPKHPKISHLASLPDSVTITNIVKRENCDEFFVTFNPPEHRACPHCESNDCIVKDSYHGARSMTKRRADLHISNLIWQNGAPLI